MRPFSFYVFPRSQIQDKTMLFQVRLTRLTSTTGKRSSILGLKQLRFQQTTKRRNQLHASLRSTFAVAAMCVQGHQNISIWEVHTEFKQQTLKWFELADEANWRVCLWSLLPANYDFDHKLAKFAEGATKASYAGLYEHWSICGVLTRQSWNKHQKVKILQTSQLSQRIC
jgi:hypothetical protein